MVESVVGLVPLQMYKTLGVFLRHCKETRVSEIQRVHPHQKQIGEQADLYSSLQNYEK